MQKTMRTFTVSKNDLLVLFVVGLISLPLTYSSELSFSYNETTGRGPTKWGDLDPKWALCKTGKMQTPINIAFANATMDYTLGKLFTRHKPALANATRTEHGIKVVYREDAGYIVINGTKYDFLQFHWHWHSEHSLNSATDVLELHLVHDSPKGLAVIGIIYKIGHSDPLLSMILSKVANMSEATRDIGKVNHELIKYDKKLYFRYMGSLTTPPCSEGVLWTVIKKKRTVSKRQLNALKSFNKDNYFSIARPIQPLNGRIVRASV